MDNENKVFAPTGEQIDRMHEALQRIVNECRLHAEGPHDKTGNMLSIGSWAKRALAE